MSSQFLWHSLYNYGSENIKKEGAKRLYCLLSGNPAKCEEMNYFLQSYFFLFLSSFSLYLFVIPALFVMAVVGGIIKKQGELF